MRLLLILLVIAGGLALAALPLTSAALIVAGTAVVIASLIQPEASLYLLVFAIPFGSLRSVSLGGLSVTATELLVALLAAGWAARGSARGELRVAHAPLILPLLLILAAQMLSLFDALSLSLAVKELLKWTEILAVYIIASSILSWRLRVLTSLLFVAALAEALLGIYQFVMRAGPEWFLIGRFLRAYGTFAQPNPYAGYLNLTLPLGYALLLAGRHGERATQRKDVILLACLAVIGAAFLMSLSRGAWLGLVVAVVVITLLHSRRTAGAALVGVALLAAVLMLSSANLLPAAITSRFSSIADYVRIFDVRNVKVTDANFSVVERMAHWQAAWSMINDRPWLGFGAGNYPAAYARYALAGWPESLGHAHNVLLNMWAEIGIIGLAAYLIFLAAALWTCWQGVRRPPAPNTGGEAWARPPAPNSGEEMWARSPAANTGGEAWAGPPAANSGGEMWSRAQAAPSDANFRRAIALGVLGVLLAKITHEMLDNLWVHGMGVQIAILLAMVYAARGGATREQGSAHDLSQR